MKILEPKHIIPYLLHELKVEEPNMLLKGIEIEKPKHYYALIECLDEKAKCKHCEAGIDKNKIIKRQIWTIKPIFRPLDLTKEIEHNGEKFVPNEWLRNNAHYFEIDVEPGKGGDIRFKDHGGNQHIFIYQDTFQKLFEWHFWIFDQSYFDEGIIIDINTLNP